MNKSILIYLSSVLMNSLGTSHAKTHPCKSEVDVFFSIGVPQLHSTTNLSSKFPRVCYLKMMS
jgi:hypothetical protein